MTEIVEVAYINSFPPPTAVWRYGRLLNLARGPGASLSTICLGHLDFRPVDRSVSAVYGDWPLPQSLTSALLAGAPGLVLPRLTAGCRDVLRRGGIVHYLAEDIRPWFSGRRVVVSIHGNPIATLRSDTYYTFGNGYRMLVASNLKRYEKLGPAVVQSKYVRDGLSEYGFGGATTLIPPAVDPVFAPSANRVGLRQALGIPDDRTIVLSVSSGERRKNLGVLPKVLERLPSDYLLVRIGPPVRGALTFSGLTDYEVAAAYAASDVLLFPTLEEGFGLPVIEAFASGLPVVASDIPVVREVAERSALLADPSDPNALAQSILEAVNARAEWVEKGRARSKEFSLDKLRARLEQFYRTLPG